MARHDYWAERIALAMLLDEGPDDWDLPYFIAPDFRIWIESTRSVHSPFVVQYASDKIYGDLLTYEAANYAAAQATFVDLRAQGEIGVRPNSDRQPQPVQA